MNRSLVLSRSLLALAAALLLLVATPVLADGGHHHHGNRGPALWVDLPVSTQGPLWPPADVTNADGDFPVVGIQLIEVDGIPGIPVFDQAWLVSRDSVPPLDDEGNRILNNWFLASYDFVRPLDLSPGSPDLDMELFALSYGPPDESGVPRIPREGDSAYNLFTGSDPCPEIYPTSVQRNTYTRPRYALNEVPIWGFQGDQVAYDIETGEPYTPNEKGGVFCPDGCPGEDVIDFRPRREPITLGDWVEASGRLKVQLTDWDDEAGGWTAAWFDFRLKNMIPHGIYTVWTVRTRRVPNSDFTPQADPIAIPSVITTDENGDARARFKVIHPFPDLETDFDLHRILGVVVAFHSDYQNWGACGGLIGNGVEIHTHLNSIARGVVDFAPDFVTVPPSDL